MVYHPNFTPTNERLREIVESHERDFPHTAMDSDLARYPNGGTPWHWHACFEFAVVVEGGILLRTPQGEAALRAGDGYFANANVLHASRIAPGETAARLHAQLFERELIAGTGLVGRRYVAPVEGCAALERVILRFDVPQERAILDDIEAAFLAAETDDRGHELDICAHLSRAWRLLYAHVEGELRSGEPAREESARTKTMLSYIHAHYTEPLSVEEIAAAAGVSARECYRCFARVLDTTPMTYLTRHRVAEAARMLAETDASAARVAEACGFSSASYFGKVFRGVMGCAPGAYRRNGD